ncbi:MAG: hypothetical protein EOO05_14170 [Chitinophagaceae bacterium]|nr:MAG: hypothetical protein EOO05_14170 [Chitinophagaceae bacterium]
MRKRRRINWRLIGIILHLVTAILFILVCLTPFLDPQYFWFIAILGLGFPFLLAVVVLFLIWRAVQRSRWAWLSVALLLVGFQQVRAVMGFHFFQPAFEEVKQQKDLRVLYWNVERWDEPNKYKNGGVSFRRLMLDAVEEKHADVLCLQEFFEPNHSKYFESNLAPLEAMGYNYHFFFPSSEMRNGTQLIGMIILSKFPIVDSIKYSFGHTPHSEGIIYADLLINGKTLRVMTTHLESSRMDKYSYMGPEGKPGKITKATRMVRKLRNAYTYRSGQAKFVKQQIDQSPYPVLLCGNMGDIPNSYAYFTVKGGLQDAFLKTGAGLGQSFRFKSPTLRLDYVFADPRIKIRQFSTSQSPYSDHFPIVVDIGLDGL